MNNYEEVKKIIKNLEEKKKLGTLTKQDKNDLLITIEIKLEQLKKKQGSSDVGAGVLIIALAVSALIAAYIFIFNSDMELIAKITESGLSTVLLGTLTAFGIKFCGDSSCGWNPEIDKLQECRKKVKSLKIPKNKEAK